VDVEKKLKFNINENEKILDKNIKKIANKFYEVQQKYSNQNPVYIQIPNKDVPSY
jgi:hypothetical protein